MSKINEPSLAIINGTIYRLKPFGRKKGNAKVDATSPTPGDDYVGKIVNVYRSDTNEVVSGAIRHDKENVPQLMLEFVSVGIATNGDTTPCRPVFQPRQTYTVQKDSTVSVTPNDLETVGDRTVANVRIICDDKETLIGTINSHFADRCPPPVPPIEPDDQISREGIPDKK